MHIRILMRVTITRQKVFLLIRHNQEIAQMSPDPLLHDGVVWERDYMST